MGEEAIPKQKRGFGAPLSAWLRGALRERVEEELLGRDSRVADLVGRPLLRAMWEEHVSGARSHQWALYSMLSLEWWRRHGMAG